MKNFRSNIDAYDTIKCLTLKTPLMVQSDVNSLLAQMDRLLSICIRKCYFIFPEYTRIYYCRLVLGWLRTKNKRYSFCNNITSDCFVFLKECNTTDVEKFGAMVDSLRLLRGMHYSFVGSIQSDFEKYSSNNCEEYRTKYKCSFSVGELNRLFEVFEVVRRIQECVEKPFYKKVISSAIALSNGNIDFVEDNFMEGARGLRKAIWRFDVRNGGILAAFIDIWINNELKLFQPHNLIKVPPGMNNLYSRLQDGLDKGKTFEKAAKNIGLSESRARDINLMMNKPANIRIDVAVGQGVEDEEIQQNELLVTFPEEEESFESIDYLLSGINDLDRKILCLKFGTFDKLPCKEITEEEIKKECDAQIKNV